LSLKNLRNYETFIIRDLSKANIAVTPYCTSSIYILITMQNYFANERTNQKQGNTAYFHNSPIGCKQNKGPKT